MAVPEASPRLDSSASHNSIRSAASSLSSDDPTRRSKVRPRSEIVDSRSAKKALAMGWVKSEQVRADTIRHLGRGGSQSIAMILWKYAEVWLDGEGAIRRTRECIGGRGSALKPSRKTPSGSCR